MSKHKSVEVQKGPIKAFEESYRTQTYGEKVREAQEHNKMRREMRDQTLHEPKR